jgi:hypothetical protein
MHFQCYTISDHLEPAFGDAYTVLNNLEPILAVPA